MSDCHVHPGRDGIGACVQCGRIICAECKTMLGGKIYCQACAERLFTSDTASASTPVKKSQTSTTATTEQESKDVKPGWLIPVIAGGTAIIAAVIVSILLIIPVITTSITKVPHITNITPPGSSNSPIFPGNLSKSTESDLTKIVTGDISTGKSEQLTKQTIGTGGGIITINQSGTSLDGMKIEIAPGTYKENVNFEISMSPIISHTFGEYFNPLTPLISIKNGDTPSDDFIILKIPVKVPEDYFAMCFIYDSENGTLRGLPMLKSEGNLMVIPMTHFSSIVISSIKRSLLNMDISTGFQPGKDDWQFPNYGSITNAWGHSRGQALSAIAYYEDKFSNGSPHLWGIYDNNINRTKTPQLWQDDSLAYRLCSCTDTEQFIMRKADTRLREWAYDSWLGSADTRCQFAYSMLMSGMPQFVMMESSYVEGVASRELGSLGLVAYRITPEGLYVADPNYPGDSGRFIKFLPNGKCEYFSGPRRDLIDAGRGKLYDSVFYYPTSVILMRDKMDARWEELYKGNTGSDTFPSYQILIEEKDENGKVRLVELKDGYIFKDKKIKPLIKRTSSGGQTCLPGDLAFDIYQPSNPAQSQEGSMIPVKKDDAGYWDLNPKTTNLGFYIYHKEGEVFTDFKYYTIGIVGVTVEPAKLTGDADREYQFTAVPSNPPRDVQYEWQVDGHVKQKSTDTTFAYKFPSASSYLITVRMLDSSGKEWATGRATANIRNTAQPSPVPQQIPPAGPNPRYISVWIHPRPSPFDTKRENIPITWNGLQFKGSDSEGTRKWEISGTLTDVRDAAGNMDIVQIDYTETYQTTDGSQCTYVFSIVNQDDLLDLDMRDGRAYVEGGFADKITKVKELRCKSGVTRFSFGYGNYIEIQFKP